MDPALIAKLLAAAIRFTELPAVPIQNLPQIVAVSGEEITREICPDKPNSS